MFLLILFKDKSLGSVNNDTPAFVGPKTIMSENVVKGQQFMKNVC